MESDGTIHLADRLLSSISANFNDSDFVESVTEPYKLKVTDEMMLHLSIYVFILLCGILAILGTVSNIINMAIFYRLGIKDSMSVYLFSLSFTDFAVSCVIIVSRILSAWNLFYTGEGIDPLAVAFSGPAFLADALFLCSGWILTFMSIERCVCVVFPFKVKQIFTKNRSIAAVVVLYILIASAFVPLYSSHRLEWINIKAKDDNKTIVKRRLIVVFSENRHQIEAVDSIISSSIIPIPSLIIIFVSVLWMTYGLIASSRFRHSMTLAKTENGGDKQDSKMAQKTRKLVKIVLVLAIIVLICSIPRIIGKYLTFLVPEVSEDGKERNLNNLIWQFARFAATVNASTNILVYLKINSAYREKFIELIPCIKTNANR